MTWSVIVPVVGSLLVVLVFVGAFLDTMRREKQVDAVLEHLLVFGESSGRDLVNFSRGVLARGTVYVLLGQLEQEKLLQSRYAMLTQRRVYSLTDRGRAEALRRAVCWANEGSR